MALERETETYQKNFASLEADEGKFVLIHQDKILGKFAAYEDALKEGYRLLGVDEPFLVKQIKAIEQIQFITRDLIFPCHT